MAGDRVRILMSGDQAGGEFVTPDAVRTAFADLTRCPTAIQVTREVPLQYLGSDTDFVLETLADGRIGITGRLAMKYEQPRCAG